MRIQPFISYKINNINNYPSNSRVLNSNNLKDTFIRSTSFGSNNDDKSFETFIEWAEKTNFTDKAMEIINETGKVLGDGFEGTTFSIPGNEQWVLKEFKRTNLIQQLLRKPEIKKIKDISPDLNIGQMIASVKIPMNDRYAHHFYVLKKQKGESFGVPFSNKDLITDSTVDRHISSLKKAAELPATAYDKLIDDISYINKRGYKIDADNPYNFMLDSKNGSINFVDIADKLDDKSFRQYGDVLFALLDGHFATNFNSSDRPEKEKELANKLSTQICSKYLSSMIKKRAKFSYNSNFDNITNTVAFEKVVGERTQEKKLEKLRIIGLY